MSTASTTTFTTTNLYSSELSCPSCIAKIERRLYALSGVEKATVHFSTGRIEVSHDLTQASVDDLVAAVAKAGYAAKPRGF